MMMTVVTSRVVVNLSSTQFATVAQAAAAIGARARADYLADGMRTAPCLAIESVDLKSAWNLSSLLAERDPGLGRALRGPAVDSQGRRSTLYWPGVTAD